MHLSQETTLKITNLWTPITNAADEDLITWLWLFHTCAVAPVFRCGDPSLFSLSVIPFKFRRWKERFQIYKLFKMEWKCLFGAAGQLPASTSPLTFMRHTPGGKNRTVFKVKACYSAGTFSPHTLFLWNHNCTDLICINQSECGAPES